MKSAYPARSLRSFRSRSVSRIGRCRRGPNQAMHADTSALPEKVLVAANCAPYLRFADVLRGHERDSDIRLHDVSRSSNAFVRRLGRRKLIFPQGIGLLAWRGHDGIMALPGMVVDRPVFDGSQNGSWSRRHVRFCVAANIPGAVEECILVALTDSTLLKCFAARLAARSLKFGLARYFARIHRRPI
jgi:hypothetical protein